MLFEAEDQKFGASISCSAVGWSRCCSTAGFPAVGQAREELSVLPSPVPVRREMMRCDRGAVDEINQMGRSCRAGWGIMTRTICVPPRVLQSGHAAVTGAAKQRMR
jgi:hypothetical protein